MPDFPNSLEARPVLNVDLGHEITKRTLELFLADTFGTGLPPTKEMRQNAERSAGDALVLVNRRLSSVKDNSQLRKTSADAIDSFRESGHGTSIQGLSQSDFVEKFTTAEEDALVVQLLALQSARNMSYKAPEYRAQLEEDYKRNVSRCIEKAKYAPLTNKNKVSVGTTKDRLTLLETIVSSSSSDRFESKKKSGWKAHRQFGSQFRYTTDRQGDSTDQKLTQLARKIDSSVSVSKIITVLNNLDSHLVRS